MTTFWGRFYRLCRFHGNKPNPVAKKLGIASSIVSQWKQGSYPNAQHLLLIADYFDVSLDYLLGRSNVTVNPTMKPKLTPKQEADKAEQLTLF